ncbi:MAG: hypothetical protein RI884_1752 [Pseudomonadota bacterium]
MSGAPVMADEASAGARKGSLLQTVRAVAWAFLGIRKNSAGQSDLGTLSPLHLIAVALVGVALFVGGLIALVHWIVP